MVHAGAPFWECRSSPEAVAPINQETSATSATPYCEHHRHVQKLLSPASFRFSRLTFSFSSRRSFTSFSFSNAILFYLLLSLVHPRVRAPPENSRSFSFRTKANIIALIRFRWHIFLREYEINDDPLIVPKITFRIE